MGATPVRIVSSGGIAVTESASGSPMTPTAMPGIAVTTVDAGGIPVTFIDEATGSAASPIQFSSGAGVEFTSGNPAQWSS